MTAKTSTLLRQFLEQHKSDEVRLKELLHQMDSRAFGSTLLIFALPETLPLPIAGVSAIVGIPLTLVSAQLVLGFRRPWLPSWVVDRPFKRHQVEFIIDKALRPLEKLECLLKPRWQFLTQPLIERLIGLLVLFLAIVLTLPIPFGNIPPAIAIVVISLGLIEGDGLMIAIGSMGGSLILGALAIAILAILPALNL